MDLYISFFIDNSAILPSTTTFYPAFFIESLIISSIFFFSLTLASPLILPKVFRSYNSLTKSTKDALPAYFTSIIHHSILLPIAIYQLYTQARDFNMNSNYSNTNFAYSIVLVSIPSGYFIVDLLLGFQNLDLLWIIHHVVSLALTLPGFGQDVLPYLPHVAICESSGLFFNFMWLIRKGILPFHESSSLYHFLSVGFVFTFFLTRIVNLPLVTYFAAVTSPDRFYSSLGVRRYLWLLMLILQFLWFFKILNMVAGMLFSTREKKSR
jgi:TLC domain